MGTPGLHRHSPVCAATHRTPELSSYSDPTQRPKPLSSHRALPFLIAHNSYLEVFLEGGVVGFALLLWMLISVVQVNQQVLAQQWRYGSLTLSLLVIVLLCNVTESSFARPQSFLWFVFLLVSMPVSVHHLQSHRTRAGRRRAAAFAGR